MYWYTAKEIEWRRLWPARIIALLATVQLLLTLAILGLEATSAAFDINYSMSFAGFYCSIFFTITWISMFTVSSCCSTSLCCTAHAVVENVLSIIAAAVLLYFNNLFLNNPYTCLFGFSSCTYTSSNSYYTSSYSIYNPTYYTVKIACIKAELACASVMLVTNVVYIVIFIVVAVKTRNLSNQRAQPTYGMGQPVSVVPVFGYPPYPAPPGPSVPGYVTCPTCRTQVPIPASQGAPNSMAWVPPPIPQPAPAVPIPAPTISKDVPIEPNSAFSSPFDRAPVVLTPVNVPLRPATPSQHESSWRSKFPRLPCLILSAVQMVLIVLIFILEIASLAVAVGYRPTGVGIWCAIPFTVASVLTFLLAYKYNRSRLWATRALVAQLVLLVFTLILIGIAGNYVQNGGYTYSSYYSTYTVSSSSSYTTKYHITQAQLAFGILLMFSGFFYVGLYAYVTFVALWQPHKTLDTPHLFRE